MGGDRKKKETRLWQEIWNFNEPINFVIESERYYMSVSSDFKIERKLVPSCPSLGSIFRQD